MEQIRSKESEHTYRLIASLATRFVMDSPRRMDRSPHYWNIESHDTRLGHPLWGFTAYSEGKILSTMYQKDPLEIVDFYLPAEDLSDGTPTQNLYFVHTDGSIASYHERAEVIDGSWEDFEDITIDIDLDEAERLKLLTNLQIFIEHHTE